jgi:hypothetical protein
LLSNGCFCDKTTGPEGLVKHVQKTAGSQRGTARELCNDGYSTNKIADKLVASWSSVKKWIEVDDVTEAIRANTPRSQALKQPSFFGENTASRTAICRSAGSSMLELCLLGNYPLQLAVIWQQNRSFFCRIRTWLQPDQLVCENRYA